MKTDILTSGYVSMDHIIKIDTPAKAGFTSLITNQSNTDIFYGGCSVNIAYGLCRLGIAAMPILRVGDDFEKTGFKQFLEEGGVSLDGITVIPDEKTSVCYLLQDNHNDHITAFYPGAMDGKYARKMDGNLFAEAMLGVVTVASCEDNKEFFRNCKKYDVPIVFGMKDDFTAFPEAFLKELLTESAIIFTNEVERGMIESLYHFDSITELFTMGKAEIIVTTRGAQGSICYTKTDGGINQQQIGTFPVDHIVDATGSGDGYITGFLYGYMQGYDPEQCCQLGSAFSSFVLQGEGCCSNMPTVKQLLDKMNCLRKGEIV